MTKTELAKELLRTGLVEESEVQPLDFLDHDQNIIWQYLGPEHDFALWLELDDLIFLASKCETLSDWLDALHRELHHRIWKFLQATDLTGLSEREIRRHRSMQERIEKKLETL
jgi:hypothetical protein